ncbi:MAG: AlpA family phage regulatory protein [bacterium]|nr:AlpA family phage regulatory protein [bacterium]
MNREFLRRRDVCARYGISTTTLHRWVSGGEFPAPVRLGGRSVRWRVSDLDRWEAERAALRDGGGYSSR